MNGKKKKVLVVGAGISGLATALRLVKEGYQVDIIEKNSQPGGRLNQLKKDGFIFDTGPSFFSMSYEFEQFAKECGITLPFVYHELDPLYSVNLRDNPKTFALFKDADMLSQQFSEVEPDFKKHFSQYMKKTEKLFHDTVDLVIKNNFNSIVSYLLTLAKVNPIHLPVLWRSFWQQVKKYFSSREAQQIISLVAFFLGRTPFDTMAVYTLLSYTEFKHDGYYNVKGGMYKIVEGLVAELQKEGVVFHYQTEIIAHRGQGKKLHGLVDQNGKTWNSDIYLINADAAVFRGRVFGRKKYSPQKLDQMNWTMGYFTIYLGLDCMLPLVNHHNYYLGSNYEAYATNIMQNPDTLQKPYYYVNVLSKHNPDCAPPGCESIFFVCPVPNLLYKPDWSDREEIASSIIADFSERINQNIQDNIVSKTIYTPIEWQDQYNLHQGSGLGLAHNMFQIGAFRPSNFDETYKNVFYTGASTIPGAGLPMGIISSKLAFERISAYRSQK